MSQKARRQYAASQKVAILRQRPTEGRPVPDVCDEHGLHPQAAILSIETDPHDPRRVFINAADVGLWYTTDAGATVRFAYFGGFTLSKPKQ